jgi:hypothetical protein
VAVAWLSVTSTVIFVPLPLARASSTSALICESSISLKGSGVNSSDILVYHPFFIFDANNYNVCFLICQGKNELFDKKFKFVGYLRFFGLLKNQSPHRNMMQ